VLWVPVYCKDYGGFARLEIAAGPAGGTPGPAVAINLPFDANGDQLADHWQHLQNFSRWNAQFPGQPRRGRDRADLDLHLPVDAAGHPAPDARPDGYADDEKADSDGWGPSVPMAGAGDGLSVLQEYRGYLLDGGPAGAGFAFRRLSIARKELLVECSEMEGIRTVGGDGDAQGTGNQACTNAQQFLLATTMESVAGFFGDPGVGFEMDLHWVRDPLNDTTGLVIYGDGSERPAYKHTGKYIDEHEPEAEPRDGWLSVVHDTRLIYEGNSQVWQNFYLGLSISAQNGNRNPACDDFVKLLVMGRKGKVRNDGCMVAWRDGSESEARDENSGENMGFQRHGAWIFVNSLAEKLEWPTPAHFLDSVASAIAHELGHLVIRGSNHPPMTASDHLVDEIGMPLPGYLMGPANGLTGLAAHPVELGHLNLRHRASINGNE
jgi:hypothetical protein